ncbi:unnamed protein product [Amoebophrya sp. A120]|nr:unnamed protein product [Amoebophrya sp. A120]|eukprot:GSA120T00019452001.1
MTLTAGNSSSSTAYNPKITRIGLHHNVTKRTQPFSSEVSKVSFGRKGQPGLKPTDFSCSLIPFSFLTFTWATSEPGKIKALIKSGDHDLFKLDGDRERKNDIPLRLPKTPEALKKLEDINLSTPKGQKPPVVINRDRKNKAKVESLEISLDIGDSLIFQEKIQENAAEPVDHVLQIVSYKPTSSVSQKAFVAKYLRLKHEADKAEAKNAELQRQYAPLVAELAAPPQKKQAELETLIGKKKLLQTRCEMMEKKFEKEETAAKNANEGELETKREARLAVQREIEEVQRSIETETHMVNPHARALQGVGQYKGKFKLEDEKAEADVTDQIQLIRNAQPDTLDKNDFLKLNADRGDLFDDDDKFGGKSPKRRKLSGANDTPFLADTPLGLVEGQTPGATPAYEGGQTPGATPAYEAAGEEDEADNDSSPVEDEEDDLLAE